MGGASAGASRGKLAAGVRVALLYPEWDRSCDTCERYVFAPGGTINRRAGLLVLRPPGTPTPCHACEKVPSAARKAGLDWRELRKRAQDMTPANRAAWRFYRESRAVGHFPDDPLVRWYAAIIRGIEDAAAQIPLERLAATLSALLKRT